MPAQYTFANTAYVEMIMTVFSQTVENTLYVRNAVPFTDVSLEQLAEAMEEWWANEIQVIVSSAVQLTTIRCRDMNEVDSYVVETNPLLTGAGTASAALPASNAIVIKFGTGLAGRAKRGRNYGVGLMEADVTGNTVSPGVTTIWVNSYAALPGYLHAVSLFWDHVVASRAGLPSTGGEGTTYKVTQYSSSGLIRTQRRRLTGIGS